MKGTVAAAFALLSSLPRWQSAHAGEYLEPTVQRHVGVLPPSVCQKLIELGEKAGFLVEKESIDEKEQSDPTKKYVPSQTIDVYEKAGYAPGEDGEHNGEEFVDAPEIWEALKPFVPKISQIVKDNRDKEGFQKYYPDDPDREPELNWVFFRKYSPDDERNSLKLHFNTNMNTVNIALNDDYVGGGLVYVKPTGLLPEGDPLSRKELRGYEWMDAAKRENASGIVYPDLRAGDAIFYSYTVEHGVAPVESGTRYSLAFFFDMDNPAVEIDFEAFDVELHNELGVELDIVRVYDAAEKKEVWQEVFGNVAPDERKPYFAFVGDRLQAIVVGTGEVVSNIAIESGKTHYLIAGNGSQHDGEDEVEFDMFKVEVHNSLPDVELDIVRVHDGDLDEDTWEGVFIIRMGQNETIVYDAFEGDRLRAHVAGTDEVVSDIEIKPDQLWYSVSSMDSPLLSEL